MKNLNKKRLPVSRPPKNIRNKCINLKAGILPSSSVPKSIDINAIESEIRYLRSSIEQCERRIRQLETKLLAAGVELEAGRGVWAFPGAVMTPVDIMKHMGKNLLLSDTPNFMKYYKSTNHGKISFGTIKRGL